MNIREYILEIMFSVVFILVAVLVGLCFLDIGNRLNILINEMEKQIDNIEQQTERLDAALIDVDNEIEIIIRKLKDGDITLEEYHKRIEEERRRSNE